MKIIKGKITASQVNQLRELNLDEAYSSHWLTRTYKFQAIAINRELALLQRHDIELKKGDDVSAGGFMLFNRFMVMAIKNHSRDGFWENNAVMQILLGLFVASVPFWVTGDSPTTFTATLWGFYVLPFVLVGLGLTTFGLQIFRVAQKIKND